MRRKLIYILIIIVGTCLLFGQSIVNYYINMLNDKYKEPITVEMRDQNLKAEADFNPENVRPLVASDFVDFNYDGLPVIGNIKVESVGIDLPIFKGLANENLMVGAGTMKKQQKMGEGNYTLAGHTVFTGYGAEKLLFTPLKHAKKGDIIEITDFENTYKYKITKTFTVMPDNVEVAVDRDGHKELTLVTCVDLEATLRLIVQAELIE